MKRAFALFLVFVFTFTFVACNTTTETSQDEVTSQQDTSTEEEFVVNKNIEKIDKYLTRDIDRGLKATNLFYRRPYTLSREPSESYPDTHGVKLTDGATMDLFYGNQIYVGWSGKSQLSVNFDMQNNENAIADISVGCLRLMAYGIGLPSYVAVQASDDGKTYTDVSKIYTPSDVPDATRQNYYFSFPKALTARYIRIYFAAQDNTFLFVDEIRGFEYSENGTLENTLTADIQEDFPVVDFYDYNLNLGESNVKVSESDADYNEERNLATIEGVDFQIIHFDNFAKNHSNSGRDKLYLLTDGKQHSENYNQDYFIFQRGGGRHVIADLGRVMAVKGCNISFLDKYTYGVATPPVYYISVSENGEDWVTVFAEDNPEYGITERGFDTRVADFGKEVRARYVRVTFQTVPFEATSSSVYMGEWEIIGKKNPAGAETATLNKDIVYGRYTDNDDIGVYNILFAGITNGVGTHCTDTHVLTEDAAFVYMAAVDENGKASGVLMDSILFATRGEVNQYADRTEGYSFFLDELFYDGLNMDAANRAKGTINAQLGTHDKEKVWISVNCPSIGDTFNGKTIQTVEDYNECIKWMIDEAERRFKEKNYQNLELVGFYWLEEAIRPNQWQTEEAHDYEACLEFNRYVHSLGYLTIWSPYYNAKGIWASHILGFDIGSLQPNHMFYSSEASRVTTAAELAKLYGISVEIEIESSAQGKDVLDYYREYLGTGYDYGYMDSVKLYYQGAVPGAIVESCNHEDEFIKAIYDETVLYATETLESNRNRKDAVDLSLYADQEVSVEHGKSVTISVGDLTDMTYRVSQLPAYGFIRLDRNGTLTFNSMKGFRGVQEIKLDIYDNVGEIKTITIKINVEA